MKAPNLGKLVGNKMAVVGLAVIVVGAAIVISVAHYSKTDHRTTQQKAHDALKQLDHIDRSKIVNADTSVETNTVQMISYTFSPQNIKVKKGTTVTWTNIDPIAHDVAESDGQVGPKSDKMAQNDSYSYTFNDAGTFKYHSAIHPNMIGTVTVTEQ